MAKAEHKNNGLEKKHDLRDKGSIVRHMVDRTRSRFHSTVSIRQERLPKPFTRPWSGPRWELQELLKCMKRGSLDSSRRTSVEHSDRRIELRTR